MAPRRAETVHHRLRARRADPVPVPDPLEAPHYERRSLYDSEAMRVVELVAHPRSAAVGPTEQQTLNVLALPLSGVFARHRGAGQRVLATPEHGLLLGAGVPYRVSFPGALGDVCLMLGFSASGLAGLMPDAIARDGFDERVFEDHALLPPALVLGVRCLHRQLLQGSDDGDALATEEAVLALLAGALGAARRERRRPRTVGAFDPRARLRPVERAKEAITVQPEQPWTLQALAEVASVSPYHLAHAFRREVGTSLHQYVLRARLGRALDRVVGSDDDLTAVALDSGFSSHSHFTARFRAHFGVTPRALRGTRRSDRPEV
jgi:AraC family transcriptional regulator